MKIGTIEKAFTILGYHDEIARFTFSAGTLHIRFIELGMTMKADLNQLVMTLNSISCVHGLRTKEPNVLWTLTLHARDVDEFKCIFAHHLQQNYLERLEIPA